MKAQANGHLFMSKENFSLLTTKQLQYHPAAVAVNEWLKRGKCTAKSVEHSTGRVRLYMEHPDFTMVSKAEVRADNSYRLLVKKSTGELSKLQYWNGSYFMDVRKF